MMRVAVGLAAALALAGCGKQGVHYDKTPTQVKTSLRQSHLPLYILGSMAQGSHVTQPDDETVVMAPTDGNGSELIRFVATVVPDGEGSRVAVAVLPPEGRNKDRIAERMQHQGFTMAIMQRLAAEHVASSIEHRSFDMTLGNPVAKMVPGMQQSLEQAHENGMAMQEMMAEAAAEEQARDDWAPSRRKDGWAPDSNDGWAAK